jgi:phosphohistidine phosphatase
MLRLFLLRHGKSDWEAPFEDDHDRPLAKRGRRASELMGRFLHTIGETPGRVISSSAVRARSTAELAAEAGGWDCPLDLTLSVYQAGPDEVVEAIRRRGGKEESLLVVGHEPTFSQLASLLIGGGTLRLPTGTLVAIRFACEEWSQVEPGKGELAWLVTPKLLARAGFEE